MSFSIAESSSRLWWANFPGSSTGPVLTVFSELGVCEYMGAPSSDNLDAMVQRSARSRFVGRTRELNSLVDVFESAQDGEMSTIIIGGEAGVGKTRLVREFLTNTCGGDDVTVLVGACRDCGESPLPYGAITEALRPLTKELVEQTRAELFEKVLSLLESAAEEKPVVVVIEDLQWADNSTRDLLGFLITNLAKQKIALIITYRSDELVDGSPFLRYVAQLARQQNVSRMTVMPFDYDDLLTHLYDIEAAPLDASLVRAIWERSQGNPFYAEELLASAEQGDSGGLPLNVRDALLSRIRALSMPAQSLIRVASATSTEVGYDVLADVVADDVDLDDALREAVTVQILVTTSSGNYEFRHALLQEVAYSQLLPGESQAVHARYASSLQENGGTAAELARHHLEAHDYGAAFQSSLEAAAAAEAARGYAESRTHYERALGLMDNVDVGELPAATDRVELLDECASMAHMEGDNLAAADLLRKALQEVVDGDPRTRLLRVRLGTYLLALGESREALVEHETVVREMSGEPPSSTHAEILCSYAQTLMAAARHLESVRHAQEALAMARAVEDPIQEARALTTLGSNLVVLGQPEDGVEYLNEALRLAEELGQPGEIAAGYRHLAATLSGPLNRLDDAYAVSKQGLKRVAELGLERHWGLALQSIAADTLFRLGRWDEAVDLVEDAIRKSANGQAAIDLLLARLKLTIGRGDFESSERDLQRVGELSERSIDLRYSLPLATLRTGLALWQHDLDAAATYVEQGLALLEDSDDVWFAAPLVWHGMRVEAERAEQARASFRAAVVEAAIERGTRFRDLLARMCQSGRQQGALRLVVDAYDVMSEGELLRIRGEAAPDIWSVVASSWTELGQPYPMAYAKLRWAEALLSRSSGVSKATPLLRDAFDVTVKMGAAPLRTDIEELARRARIDLSAPLEPVDTVVVDVRDAALERLRVESGLTKREVQILSLVADGKSNRGIAASCFITEKTASVHVSNILMKLNVTSRVQAAAVLHRALSSN